VLLLFCLAIDEFKKSVKHRPVATALPREQLRDKLIDIHFFIGNTTNQRPTSSGHDYCITKMLKVSRSNRDEKGV
jgi:hypothetical protein